MIQAIAQGVMVFFVGKLMSILAYGLDKDGVFHKLISLATYLVIIVVCEPLFEWLVNILLKYPIEKLTSHTFTTRW